MRLLITGGAGFIGSNLSKLALKSGIDVTVLDDLSTGYRANLDGLDVKFVEGSILDPRAMASSLIEVDAIVHLAALGSVPRSIVDPMATHAANATGTLTVLEAARAAGIRHFVVSSSSSVYGMNPALPKSEREWVRPMSPYAVSKLATEQYALAYQQSFGMQTLAFRFFNVYGPGQRSGHAYAAVIPIFIEAILNGNSVPVNGDGLHSRDYTYVGTVCRVLIDAVQRRVTHPEPINLAFGTNTTLKQLISVISDQIGGSVTIDHRPARDGDVLHSQADHSVLNEVFPTVRPIPLVEGIAKTIQWFQETR